MNQVPVITLDGPGGAGKGTISSALSQTLNWHLLDSGVLYRLTAFACLEHKIKLTDVPQIVKQAQNLPVRFVSDTNHGRQIFFANEEVSLQLHTEELGAIASQIAQISEVRKALLTRQRAFRKTPGLVADGRDMGTVVFPDALLKIFLTASVTERARRRFDQLRNAGHLVKMQQLVEEMKRRDERDQNRLVAPLKPASDAVIIDTTDLTEIVVLERIRTLLNDRGVSLRSFVI